MKKLKKRNFVKITKMYTTNEKELRVFIEDIFNS